MRLLEVIYERGELIPQVSGVRNIRREPKNGCRRRRIDIHVPCVRERAAIRIAERPVAVGSFVDADARERIPFAEEHAIPLMPLRVHHIETGDAGKLTDE